MKEDISVVKIGKSQYLVKKGDQILVEKLEGNPGDKVTFDSVLLQVKKGSIDVGNPYIKGKKVEAKILAQTKGKKIEISKYKAKSRYRRKAGHRQQLTSIEIQSM